MSVLKVMLYVALGTVAYVAVSAGMIYFLDYMVGV